MAVDADKNQQLLTSTFLSAVDDLSYNNKLRPYTSGTTEHNDPIATIILYNQSNIRGATAYINYATDYLNNLGAVVESLQSGVVDPLITGAPENPNGDIPILTLDNTHAYYGVFNNFSLTGINESHEQITKVHMNFSARWNVFFFGNTPNIYQFRGVFIDTMEYPYYQEFMVAYEKYLSGRKCVENLMQTKILVSGQLIDGFLMNVSVVHNANTPTVKEFTFTMLVKGTSWIRINRIKNDQSFPEDVLNGLSNIGR